MKRPSIIAFFILAGLLLFSIPLGATEDITVRRRMSERLPELDALRLSGHLGENNIGYLESRKELTPEQETLVSAENGDRKTIYSIIAIKTYSTSKKIGEHRARLISEHSIKGMWLQSEEGEWYKK